ncbi:class I SAM-dependent methyltransferase [Pseudomonas sp. RIT-PI-AD]|uniref:class I SAM-dependent methyltransferase n=1 Tax=Pseudomonas sp. RIT-PI-AD TaxID=3035294 RepID=UPI0021D7F285|nr:class I SAM-dependent methyltransferase [Pseudomonas sp. RIT-PI-AD]
MGSIGRYPALLALWVQLAAAVSTLVLFKGLAALALYPGLMAAAWVQGVAAAVLGQACGLSVWWLPINLAFVPALLALQGRHLPPLLPLAGFAVALLLNWNSFGERVPLYLTGRRTRQRLLEWLATQPREFTFIDLGCGLGGALHRLARAYPAARFEGVETAPLAFCLAWLRCLPARNCRIRYRNLWTVDLGAYDVVYCFLSPVPMPALGAKARAQMRPGAWLISNSFDIPGMPPEQTLEVRDWRHARLLLWRPGGDGSPCGGNPP